jgi:hypothetical protein
VEESDAETMLAYLPKEILPRARGFSLRARWHSGLQRARGCIALPFRGRISAAPVPFLA